MLQRGPIFFLMIMFFTALLPAAEKSSLTPQKVASELAIARRFFKAGSYSQAEKIYRKLLNHEDFGVKKLKRLSEKMYPDVKDPQERIKRYREYKEARLLRQQRWERALFFATRCKMELAENNKEEIEKLIALFNKLVNNTAGLDKPLLCNAARYWSGQVYLLLGRRGDAGELFRKVKETGTDPAYDYLTSQALAFCLEKQADVLLKSGRGKRGHLLKEAHRLLGRDPGSVPGSKLKLDLIRRELLEDAIRLLTRITIAYPNNPRRREVELNLIRLQMSLLEYKEAAELATRFLVGEPPGTSARTQALLYLAQCRYFAGHLGKAITLYDNMIRDERLPTEILKETLYGQGYSHYRFAYALGARQRRYHLNQARMAFERLLEFKPLKRIKALPVELTLSEILIHLEEPIAAISYLTPIVSKDESKFRIRANYLLGIAHQKRLNDAEAVNHFSRVIRLTTGRQQPSFLLKTLLALADLQQRRGFHAEACIYYTEAAEYSRKYRDYASVARAELGVATALVDLGVTEKRKWARALENAGEACLSLVISSGESSINMQRHATSFAFRLHSIRLWDGFKANAKSRTNNIGLSEEGFTELQTKLVYYRNATNKLQHISHRYGARLRQDELTFQTGRALFFQAKAKKEALAADSRKMAFKSISEYAGKIFREYEGAAETMRRAAKINSRGQIAPKAYFYLGLIRYDHGLFAFAMVPFLRNVDKIDEAQSQQEEGKKMMRLSLDAFDSAVSRAGSLQHQTGIPLRIIASWQKGQALKELEEYDLARQVFRRIVGDPLAGHLRIPATRDWATCLVKMGHLSIAADKLAPYVEADLEAAIQRGRILEKLGLPHIAHQTYMSGQKTDGDDDNRKAEILYHTHRLGLMEAAAIKNPEEVEALRTKSSRQLKAMIKQYPETKWASRGLLDLGLYHLTDAGGANPAEALALADTFLKNENPHLRQASYLLRGKAYQADNQNQEALSSFETAESMTGGLSQFTAQAILNQAMIYQQNGNRQKAYVFYSKVLARFPHLNPEAEIARTAIVEICLARAAEYRENGEFEKETKYIKLAKEILESNNKQLSPAMRELSEKIKNRQENAVER